MADQLVSIGNDINKKLKDEGDGTVAEVISLGSSTAIIGKVGIDPANNTVAQRAVDAAFTQLVRPANVTPYSANDSISNNATAGSVTALAATAGDLNDAPVTLTEMLLDTNDTGIGNGASVRAFIFNSDPTASSGVQAGDNAAFSQKKAGFIGSMSGTFRSFFDGGKARLVPDEGNFIICHPVSGGVTLWYVLQSLSAPTPSANSTTIDAKIKGFQARA